MYKQFLFLILSLTSIIRLNGQDGGAYIYNYPFSDFNETPIISQIVQNNRGTMFFLTDIGLVEYDGASWGLISTENIPYKIYADQSTNKIFIADILGIGFFDRNDYGEYEYKTIARFDTDSVLDINIDNINNKLVVWFGKQFYIINMLTQELEYHTKFNAVINECLTINNKIILSVRDADETCFYYNGKAFENYPKHQFFNHGDLLFNCSYEDSLELIGTANGLVLLCNANTIVEQIEIDYLKNNYLTNAIMLSDQNIAFSTLSGGILVIDKTTKKTVEVLNVQNGLPDDEIKSMFKDKVGSFWVSHGLGLSKIELNLPIRNISVYPGIVGEKTGLLLVDDRIYVGTNDGLFYLSKVENLDEVSHYIKKESKVTQNIETYTVLREVNRVVRLKAVDNLRKEDEYQVREIPITFKIPVDSVVSNVTNEFKDELVRGNYAKISIPFIYKKINGLNARCNSLLPFKGNSLLAATNTGLWLVKNLEVSSLIEKDNISKVYVMADTSIIYAISESKLYRLNVDTTSEVIDQRIAHFPDQISSVAANKGEVFIASGNKIFKIDDYSSDSLNTIAYNQVRSFEDDVDVYSYQDNLYLVNQDQLSLFDSDTSRASQDTLSLIKPGFSSINPQHNFLWRNDGNEFTLINSKKSNIIKYLNVFRNIDLIYTNESSNLWVIGDNQLYRISDTGFDGKQIPFAIEVEKVTDSEEKGLSSDDIELSYYSNSLKIFISPNYYLNEENIQYSFFMEGIDEEWSSWSKNSVFEYRYIPPGKYKLLVRAINILGEVSEPDPIDVFVKKPFWKSIWFIVLASVFIIFLAWFFSYLRNKKLARANLILQGKIQKATAEIVKQKDELEVAYKEIEKKNKDIIVGINYAERIQTGVLADEEEIKKTVPNLFILNRPMEIVSGDFYWYHENTDEIIIVAADCTGHGVPGAFMSMIGNTLLNQIVHTERISDPGVICKRLDEEVINVLKQDKDTSISDGMDISICKYTKGKDELHFCGAMNNLIYFKNDEMNIVDAERHSIGGTMYGTDKQFTTKIIEKINGSTFYIFSDGFQDQLGGTSKLPKKFMSGKFKALLQRIHQIEFDEQKRILDEECTNWLGGRGQIDDILVIGFKL